MSKQSAPVETVQVYSNRVSIILAYTSGYIKLTRRKPVYHFKLN